MFHLWNQTDSVIKSTIALFCVIFTRMQAYKSYVSHKYLSSFSVLHRYFHIRTYQNEMVLTTSHLYICMASPVYPLLDNQLWYFCSEGLLRCKLNHFSLQMGLSYIILIHYGWYLGNSIVLISIPEIACLSLQKGMSGWRFAASVWSQLALVLCLAVELN